MSPTSKQQDRTGHDSNRVPEPPVDGRSVPTGNPDLDQGKHKRGVVSGQPDQPAPVPPPDPPPTNPGDPRPSPKPAPKPDEGEDKAVVTDRDE